MQLAQAPRDPDRQSHLVVAVPAVPGLVLNGTLLSMPFGPDPEPEL
jgi:hypothetical protein